MPFQHFPKETVIFKTAQISIPTTRVFGKYPRVRQIYSQMEKLSFLEIWNMNWGSAKATNHCGTFMYNMKLKISVCGCPQPAHKNPRPPESLNCDTRSIALM